MRDRGLAGVKPVVDKQFRFRPDPVAVGAHELPWELVSKIHLFLDRRLARSPLATGSHVGNTEDDFERDGEINQVAIAVEVEIWDCLKLFARNWWFKLNF